MATIRENRKNGKVVSYRFTACLERDARGKQVRKYHMDTALRPHARKGKESREPRR